MVFAFGHVEYASPVGKLRDANNKGIGLEAGIGAGLSRTFFTGTVGITWLVVNRSGTTQGGLRYTPYKVGVRRYVLFKNLFLKGELGAATMKYIDTEQKSSHLTTSIGAGLKFTRFEALVDYNTVFGDYGSWFGLKLGVALGF
ncbi:MAG: hypothetical protein K0Q66_2301 [Chitinophagaceae bacterium]|nr:hypothetical protein [Chitinophagaceae bacterium]